MHNVFFILAAVMAASLWVVSTMRLAGDYRFENAGVTILQYGLAFEMILLFHYGLLWEVLR